MKKKVKFIDPPSGWRYGFPKIQPEKLPEEFENWNEWLVSEGYPQKEIDRLGEYFYCRHWTQEVEVD